jgi:hypothetical protein
MHTKKLLCIFLSSFLCWFTPLHALKAAPCYHGNPLYPFQFDHPQQANANFSHFDYTQQSYSPGVYHQSYFVHYPMYTGYYHPIYIGGGCHHHGGAGLGGHHGSNHHHSGGGKNGEAAAIIAIVIIAVIAVVIVGYGVYYAGKAIKAKYQRSQLEKAKDQHNKLMAVLSDAYALPSAVAEYHSSTIASPEEAASFAAFVAARGKTLNKMFQYLNSFHFGKLFHTGSTPANLDALAQLLREANESGALCTNETGGTKYYGYREVKELIMKGTLQERIKVFPADRTPYLR